MCIFFISPKTGNYIQNSNDSSQPSIIGILHINAIKNKIHYICTYIVKMSQCKLKESSISCSCFIVCDSVSECRHSRNYYASGGSRMLFKLWQIPYHNLKKNQIMLLVS